MREPGVLDEMSTSLARGLRLKRRRSSQPHHLGGTKKRICPVEITESHSASEVALYGPARVPHPRRKNGTPRNHPGRL